MAYDNLSLRDWPIDEDNRQGSSLHIYENGEAHIYVKPGSDWRAEDEARDAEVRENTRKYSSLYWDWFVRCYKQRNDTWLRGNNAWTRLAESMGEYR